MLDVVPTAEPEAWLRKNALITLDGKVTVGALLLFSDLPQAQLPKSGIKISRYKTAEKEGTRDTLADNPTSVEGCLYELINTSVDLTKKIIENISIIGPSGAEKISYPNEALHEVVTNAVLHRDYSLNDDIHIRIFDNRVEIESPGKLPAHITIKNILSERFARNSVLVRLINKFPDPPNKDIGEGLNTVFAAMKKLRLKQPDIIEKDHSVLVVIKHERLGSAEDIIRNYLDANEIITNAKARELVGIGSENKIKSIFYRMRDAGEIVRVEGLKGSKSAWKRVHSSRRVAHTAERRIK